MEFGKLSSLENVSWNLPADDPLNLDFLKSLPNATGKAKFHIGAPAWGHKQWLGKIYPPGTKPTEFLTHYAKNFNCIELNTTHYRIPTEAQVSQWKSQVSKDFIFCPKLLQEISHSLMGMADEAALKEWWQSLEFFGENLGPTFVQFPPHFTYANKNDLFYFLQKWPKAFPLCLEFRHTSWFHQGHVLPALTKFLQDNHIGLVITDTAGRRDVVHTSISAPYTFIRFVGNTLHPTDYERAAAWADRLHEWQSQGLQHVFFIIHQPDDFASPEMADFVISKFNETANAGLLPIQFMAFPGL
ncbi:MAG: DUF72 domain-containing protein [Bdellovibrionota bacterium]